MKIGFVTFEKQDNRTPNSIGSTRIRARWLYDRWEDAEEYHIGKQYDVLIFQKVYWEAMLTQFEGIKILDLCDPDWLEGRDVIRYCDMADAVTTSTQPLADYILKFLPDKKVICVPDRVALDEYKPIKTKHETIAKEVVWFGYHQNFHYLTRTLNKLIQQGLSLAVIADKNFSIPPDIEIEVKSLKYQYPGINEQLIARDLAILPTTDDVDEKGKYKSNNKTIQCWALGLPVARTPDELVLLASVEARKAEAKKRLKQVKEEYDVMLSVEQYKELIDDIKKEKKKESKN